MQQHELLAISGAPATGPAESSRTAPADTTPKKTASAPPLRGERRKLTALFADLVDSTGLLMRHGDERHSELLEAYRRLCEAAVERYDGSIELYQGDGLLAYFGYPTAHEDDAVRAVRAGLDLLERARGLRIGGESVGIRIAIHSDSAVVGSGSTRKRASVRPDGKAFYVAARLQAEAGLNDLLITEETRRLIGGFFELEDLAPLRLKGLDDLVHPYRVLREARSVSRFDAWAGAGLTPLTGRSEEIAALAEAWAEAGTGGCQSLVMRGEAGIGKSRLLNALGRLTQELPCRHLVVQCSAHHTNTPFFPVAQTLKRHLAFTDDIPADVRRRHLEEFIEGAVNAGPLADSADAISVEEATYLIAPLLSTGGQEGRSPTEMSAVRRRQRTIEVLGALILATAEDLPMLVVVEDLHWADPSTLELLERFLDRLHGRHALVASSTRADEDVVDERLKPLLSRSRVIDLDRLDPTETRSLVRRVVGSNRLPESLVAMIAERTMGNPLFVEAFTRGVLDSGSLRAEGGRLELDGQLPEALIPESVHDSLTARLDSLGAAKPIAQVASAIGNSFTIELLREVVGLEAEEVEAALEKMVNALVIRPSDGGSEGAYAFTHALIHRAAYFSLLERDRTRFHSRILEVLLERFPETLTEEPEVIARHYEGAGDIRKAIESWLAAGSRMLGSGDRECVGFFRSAISLLEQMPDDDPWRLSNEIRAQLALAPALMATEGWGSPQVEQACLRARELCEASGNGEGLVAALWGLWTFSFVRADYGRALEIAETVHAMALAAGSPILQIAAGHALCFTRYFRGEFEEARKSAEAALRLYNLEQERAIVATFRISSSMVCLAVLRLCLRFLGYPDQAWKRHQELEELIEQLDTPACTASGLGIGMHYDADLRDLRTIEQKAGRGYQLCIDEGFHFWAAGMRVYRGWAWSLEGNTVAGLQELREGLTAYVDAGGNIAMPGMLMMLSNALEAAGKPAEALLAIDAGIAVSNERGERYCLAELHRTRARIQLSTDPPAIAEETLRKGLSIAREQMARLIELRISVELARLLVSQNRVKEAEELLTPLHDWFTEGFNSRELEDARGILEGLRRSSIQ